MKKFALVFIISFILALGIFLGVQYYINIHSEKGALQVTSSPQSKVYINGSYIGQTPLCKCEATDMIVPGEYTIRVVPVGSSFQEFQEKITISQGVLTVVDRKFGSNGQSEGSIISLTPLENKNAAQLVVVSFPQGAKVLLDDQGIGTTPLSSTNPTISDHDLKIDKDGYNEKEIRIRTPQGYKLTVAAYLSTSTTSLSVPTASSSASTSPDSTTPASPTPTTMSSVTILDSPIGYVHLRAGPSLSAAEVGQATSGKTYPLIDVQAGWYEITVSDGTTGWISAQYGQKN
ncbi:MAG TPA: PEGA domain-containing protein [Candidatus Saccharimonadales bacterium]|nr:PEGA domain-containing protein [Candidatus Saccharimonadales bacterium]